MPVSALRLTRLTPLQFILLLTTARTLWHLLEPIGMTGDESYYWLWGQHWDWGYYSKPPLIGWFYGLADCVPFPKTWWIKGWAALFSGGSLFFLHRCFLTATQNKKLAWYGLLAFALTPANLLFSSILTIDSPLMFFWTGGMYYAARLILGEGSPRGRDYLLLWLFLSLGHLTKQMMMLQVVIILLCVLALRRPLLCDLRLWLCLILSFLALLPPLIWNAENDWITFQHTAHHFERASPSLGKSFSRLGELLGALLGLVSPLIFILFFPAIGAKVKSLIFPIKNLSSSGDAQRLHTERRAETFFFLFGALGLIVMLGMAFRQRVNPNWPAVYLLGGLGLTMLWAFRTSFREKLLRVGIKLSAGLSLLLMITLPFLEPLAEPLAQLGIKPQRRGWQGYPTLVSQVYELLPPDVEQLTFRGHRFNASQFAYHGKLLASDEVPLKSVHLWNSSAEIKNQFDFFPTPEVGEPIAIIIEQKKKPKLGNPIAPLPTDMADYYHSVEELGSFPMHRAREFPQYKIYLAKRLIKWPKSPFGNSSLTITHD